MTPEKALVRSQSIESLILSIRDQRVMLDRDLAKLYGVSTKALNQAVKRNSDRFPPDFMFRLAKDEKDYVVTNCDHLHNLKYSKVLPHAFTEHGAIMLASVLNSQQAIETSVFVVRAFVRMREILGRQKELVGKIEQIERKVGQHDEDIKALVAAIKQLIIPPEPKKKQIGFK
ncbi:MAG: ORF6N domain-containing protein [candidate division Zixibacteria bacterium]|nr:ORF6N domain-containing protein [candidate division Zixibacteria bacterium]MBU1469348.1 ORF6N domain-containing protein [candidate division Zixibacteria bacterium]